MFSNNIKNISLGYLILMGIIFSVIFYFAPHTGDDMGYANSIPVFSGKFGGNEFLGWIYNNGRHWFFSNGRMANYMASGILYWLPQWIIALLDGFMQAYLGFIILKVSGLWGRKLFASLLVLAFIWLALPWWDSGLLTDVALNYTWSVSFGLTVVYWILFYDSSKSPGFLSLIMILFAFGAGMMHEAMSVPIVISFLGIYFFSKFQPLNFPEFPFNPFRKSLIISFSAGTFLVVSSPGIWKRFLKTTSGIPDDPFPLLFIKSDFLVILLFFIILFFLTYQARISRKFFNFKLMVFIGAAFCSAFFSGISGTVGRSGFFAQIYSLIAIIILFKDLKFKVYKPLSFSLGAIIVISTLFCYSFVLYWEIKRGIEFREVMKAYINSKDGIVYYDYTDDRELPFYTLGITAGVPDPDDYYPLQMIEEYKGGGKPFIVLPKNLENWNGDLHEEKLFTGKGYITSLNPSSREIHYSDNDHFTGIYEKGDSVFTVTPFSINSKKYFYVQPIDLDYGDRLHYE